MKKVLAISIILTGILTSVACDKNRRWSTPTTPTVEIPPVQVCASARASLDVFFMCENGTTVTLSVTGNGSACAGTQAEADKKAKELAEIDAAKLKAEAEANASGNLTVVCRSNPTPAPTPPPLPPPPPIPTPVPPSSPPPVPIYIPPPPPVSTVSADIKCNGSDGPCTIAYNTVVNISWTSQGATGCTISPTGWSGISGVMPTILTSQTSYVINCNNATNSATDLVTVFVVQPPPPVRVPPQLPCIYTISAVPDFTYTGGNGSVSIGASRSDCQWTARSDVYWIEIKSGSYGNGTGTVFFTVAMSNGSRREGTITVTGTDLPPRTVRIVERAQ